MPMTAFEKIKAGLEDAIAYAGGDDSRALIHVPEKVDAKGVRKGLNMTQEEFAVRYGFSLARVRDWEQGRSQPDSAVRAYLLVIKRERAAVDRALHIE